MRVRIADEHRIATVAQQFVQFVSEFDVVQAVVGHLHRMRKELHCTKRNDQLKSHAANTTDRLADAA